MPGRKCTDLPPMNRVFCYRSRNMMRGEKAVAVQEGAQGRLRAHKIIVNCESNPEASSLPWLESGAWGSRSSQVLYWGDRSCLGRQSPARALKDSWLIGADTLVSLIPRAAEAFGCASRFNGWEPRCLSCGESSEQRIAQSHQSCSSHCSSFPRAGAADGVA